MVAASVKPDAKKRVVLPKALVEEGITYHIYTNKFGQIVLDPQVTIPASELWLFKNPRSPGVGSNGDLPMLHRARCQKLT